MATPDHTNLLLGLIYLRAPRADDLRALYFPDRSQVSVDKYLRQLHRDGLAAPERWAEHSEARTRPQRARWVITPAGRALAKQCDAYPRSVQAARHKQLRQHDARVTTSIVQLIRAARQSGLCSVSVRYEMRLDPQRLRPQADAMLWLQLDSAGSTRQIVPWARDPPAAGQGCCCVAIEADNATESPAALGAKGRAYAQLLAEPRWQAKWRERYGSLPTILWVAPTEVRAELIRTQVVRARNCPRVLVTTDTALHADLDAWIAAHAPTGAFAQPPGLLQVVPPSQPVATMTVTAPIEELAATPLIVPKPARHITMIHPPLPSTPPRATNERDTPRSQPLGASQECVRWLQSYRSQIIGIGMTLVFLMAGVLMWPRMMVSVMPDIPGTSAQPTVMLDPIASAPAFPTQEVPELGVVCGPVRTRAALRLRAAPGLRARVVRTARAGELLTAHCDQPWPRVDDYTWVLVHGERDREPLWAAETYLEAVR
jgi:hypothetical protein